MLRLICLFLGLIILYGCQKETSFLQNAANHELGFISEKRVKINQAVVIYDSTEIKDSIDFVNPPAGYEWKITPGNNCDSLIGNVNKGITGIIFHCPGVYQVTAYIYDSLHHLTGNTNTVQVEVTTDTLYPTQPIKADDTLIVQPGIVKTWNDSFTEIYIQLILSTSKTYDYYSPYIEFDYTTNTGNNSFAYSFNSIRLSSYPLAIGYGVKDKVWGAIDLKGLTIGIPVNISITWLGQTYTGTITLINEYQCSSSWNNTGAVIIKE